MNNPILQIRLSDTVELDAKTDNTLICNMIENNAVPFNNNAVFIIVGGDINLPFGIIIGKTVCNFENGILFEF